MPRIVKIFLLTFWLLLGSTTVVTLAASTATLSKKSRPSTSLRVNKKSRPSASLKVNKKTSSKKTSQPTNQKTSYVPPARHYPATIKGNWEPGEDFLERMLKHHLPELKTLGVNTLSVVPGYEYKDGKPRLRGFGPLRNSNQRFIDIIRSARTAGFAVLLCPDFVGGDGAKVRVAEEQLLREMKSISLEWAKIAEQEKVEYFCPSNELNWVIRYNYYLDDNLTGQQKAHDSADRFHRELLPELKKIYSGRTMYKGASSDRLIDATGYDYLGLDFGHYGNSPEDFRKNVKTYFDAFAKSAKQSNTQWLIGELWLPYNQKGQPTHAPSGESYDALQEDLYQMVFDEYTTFAGDPKPQGLLFIAYLMDGIEIRNRPAEAVVKQFFTTLP